MSSSDLGTPEGLPRQPFLVVTGSSAGGIDALSSFVSNLPDNFTIPIVVAQHLAPSRTSRLEEILAQQTTLTVTTILDEAVVEPRHIYVVPPDHDVEVNDSIATTRLQVHKGPKPSIDRLFSSAAELYSDRLIAIVLSGLGSDGVRGVRAVKKMGGTVIVQDPQSAGFAAMPLAIPPTLVDISAAPEAMGRIILDILGASETPSDGSERNLLRVLLAQLRERSGIDFSQYKTPTIMRRLSRLMVASGVSSISDYLPYLQRNPEGYQRLVNSFLIKVTEFFRDAALFETLRDHILPGLMAEAREQNREVRIWSAGTSTGEEAYSLAILCAELMRDEPSPVDVRIFATDVDEQAVAFARRGIYSSDSLRHVPESLVSRYFSKHDDRFEVSKPIRNMTVFGQHDLGQRAPFPRIDLVLCRNVLIYFTKELQTRALQLFAFALRDGGYLVLGKAESTTPLPQFFKLSNSALKIYEREGERVLLPPTRIKDVGQPAPLPAFLANAAREIRNTHGANEAARPASQEIVSAYMNGSVIGVVAVDRNYDIVAINSAARAMLQIHGVGIGSDLIHLLPSMGAKLRLMVDAALSGEAVEPTVLLAKDPVTASAARVEAEARIRAALRQTRRSRHAAPGPADAESDGEESGDPAPAGNHERPEADAQARTDAALQVLAELGQAIAGPQAPAREPQVPAARDKGRPEAASGARPWLAVAPDGPAAEPAAAAGGAAGEAAAHALPPAGGTALDPAAGPPAFGDPYAPAGPPASAAPASGHPEPGGAPEAEADIDDAAEDAEFDDRPEHASGYAKRNRIARGYSIPRLSRTKKPGAVPGT